MEMVSMAIEPSAESKMYGASPVTCSPYPYGLRLCLNQEQLEALGITDLPPAGTQLRLAALAVVTRSSTEDPDADGDVDYVSVEMQVTELGVEEGGESDEDEEPDGSDQDGDSNKVLARAERMYSKGKQPA